MATQKALRKRQERQAQDVLARLDALEAKLDEVLALLKKPVPRGASSKAKQG